MEYSCDSIFKELNILILSPPIKGYGILEQRNNIFFMTNFLKNDQELFVQYLSNPKISQFVHPAYWYKATNQ